MGLLLTNIQDLLPVDVISFIVATLCLLPVPDTGPGSHRGVNDVLVGCEGKEVL